MECGIVESLGGRVHFMCLLDESWDCGTQDRE